MTINVRLDTAERKSVDLTKAIIKKHPRKYSDVFVSYDQNLGYVRDSIFEKCGDIEAVIYSPKYRGYPYFLGEIKIEDDLPISIYDKRLFSELERMTAAPHMFKFLFVCGVFDIRTQLILNSVSREYLYKGIETYHFQFKERMIEAIFNMILSPPVRDKPIKQQIIPYNVQGALFCRQLQQHDGISYDFAEAISKKYHTPVEFQAATVSDIEAIMNEVDAKRAKERNRQRASNKYKKLPQRIHNHFVGVKT